MSKNQQYVEHVRYLNAQIDEVGRKIAVEASKKTYKLSPPDADIRS